MSYFELFGIVCAQPICIIKYKYGDVRVVTKFDEGHDDVRRRLAQFVEHILGDDGRTRVNAKTGSLERTIPKCLDPTPEAKAFAEKEVTSQA
jgi:hypothetical protein